MYRRVRKDVEKGFVLECFFCTEIILLTLYSEDVKERRHYDTLGIGSFDEPRRPWWPLEDEELELCMRCDDTGPNILITNATNSLHQILHLNLYAPASKIPCCGVSYFY